MINLFGSYKNGCCNNLLKLLIWKNERILHKYKYSSLGKIDQNKEISSDLLKGKVNNSFNFCMHNFILPIYPRIFSMKYHYFCVNNGYKILTNCWKNKELLTMRHSFFNFGDYKYLWLKKKPIFDINHLQYRLSHTLSSDWKGKSTHSDDRACRKTEGHLEEITFGELLRNRTNVDLFDKNHFMYRNIPSYIFRYSRFPTFAVLPHERESIDSSNLYKDISFRSFDSQNILPTRNTEEIGNNNRLTNEQYQSAPAISIGDVSEGNLKSSVAPKSEISYNVATENSFAHNMPKLEHFSSESHLVKVYVENIGDESIKVRKNTRKVEPLNRKEILLSHKPSSTKINKEDSFNKEKGTLSAVDDCKIYPNKSSICEKPVSRNQLPVDISHNPQSILNIINSIDKTEVIISKDLYITNRIIDELKEKKKSPEKKPNETNKSKFETKDLNPLACCTIQSSLEERKGCKQLNQLDIVPSNDSKGVSQFNNKLDNRISQKEESMVNNEMPFSTTKEILGETESQPRIVNTYLFSYKDDHMQSGNETRVGDIPKTNEIKMPGNTLKNDPDNNKLPLREETCWNNKNSSPNYPPTFVDSIVSNLKNPIAPGNCKTASSQFRGSHYKSGNDSDCTVDVTTETNITSSKCGNQVKIQVHEVQTFKDKRLPLSFTTDTLMQMQGSNEKLREVTEIVEVAKAKLVLANTKSDASGKSNLDHTVKLAELLSFFKHKLLLGNGEQAKKLPILIENLDTGSKHIGGNSHSVSKSSTSKQETNQLSGEKAEQLKTNSIENVKESPGKRSLEDEILLQKKTETVNSSKTVPQKDVNTNNYKPYTDEKFKNKMKKLETEDIPKTSATYKSSEDVSKFNKQIFENEPSKKAPIESGIEEAKIRSKKTVPINSEKKKIMEIKPMLDKPEKMKNSEESARRAIKMKRPSTNDLSDRDLEIIKGLKEAKKINANNKIKSKRPSKKGSPGKDFSSKLVNGNQQHKSDIHEQKNKGKDVPGKFLGPETKGPVTYDIIKIFSSKEESNVAPNKETKVSSDNEKKSPSEFKIVKESEKGTENINDLENLVEKEIKHLGEIEENSEANKHSAVKRSHRYPDTLDRRSIKHKGADLKFVEKEGKDTFRKSETAKETDSHRMEHTELKFRKNDILKESKKSALHKDIKERNALKQESEDKAKPGQKLEEDHSATETKHAFGKRDIFEERKERDLNKENKRKTDFTSQQESLKAKSEQDHMLNNKHELEKKNILEESKENDLIKEKKSKTHFALEQESDKAKSEQDHMVRETKELEDKDILEEPKESHLHKEKKSKAHLALQESDKAKSEQDHMVNTKHEFENKDMQEELMESDINKEKKSESHFALQQETEENAKSEKKTDENHIINTKHEFVKKDVLEESKKSKKIQKRPTSPILKVQKSRKKKKHIESAIEGDENISKEQEKTAEEASSKDDSSKDSTESPDTFPYISKLGSFPKSEPLTPIFKLQPATVAEEINIDIDKLSKETKPPLDPQNTKRCLVSLDKLPSFPLLNTTKTNYERPKEGIICVDCKTDPVLRQKLRTIPSVTRVLNATMSDSSRIALAKWRTKMIAQLGETGFHEFYKGQIESGSDFHDKVQKHFKGEKQDLFNSTNPALRSISNISKDISEVCVVESHVIHQKLAYRGIIDCVAKYKNKPVLIEWKRSDKRKSVIENTYDAPLQLCAYIGALNYDNNYKLQVDGGVVIVAYSDGTPADVFTISMDDCNKYWQQWLGRFKQYMLDGQPTMST